MTAKQLEFLAQMIVDGHAKLIVRAGKIVPVSRI